MEIFLSKCFVFWEMRGVGGGDGVGELFTARLCEPPQHLMGSLYVQYMDHTEGSSIERERERE